MENKILNLSFQITLNLMKHYESEYWQNIHKEVNRIVDKRYPNRDKTDRHFFSRIAQENLNKRIKESFKRQAKGYS